MRRHNVGPMCRSKANTVAALLVTLALVAAGCGSSSSSTSAPAASSPPASATSTPASTTSTTGTVKLAKTKFVIHAGLAFGAFHR